MRGFGAELKGCGPASVFRAVWGSGLWVEGLLWAFGVSIFASGEY